MELIQQINKIKTSDIFLGDFEGGEVIKLHHYGKVGLLSIVKGNLVFFLN